MAIEINVVGSYNDRDIKKAQRDLEKLGKVAGDQGKSITDSMDKLSAGMVAAGTTLTKNVTLPIVGAGAAMFAAFTKQEDAEARLGAALKATGGVAGVTADHILDLASSLQGTTTFGDEATIAAAGLLLTFKDISNAAGDGNDVFDRTIKVGQDLAAFMGTDLDSAMMQLGMAINSPAEGLGRLTRSGINFSDEQKEMIKQMAESGDVLGAQKLILAEVESQFGGTAETMAQTSSGQIKQAFNSLGDAAEGFGEIIAKSVSKVADFLKDLGERFQDLSPETKELIVKAAAIAAALGPMLVIGGKIVGMVSTLTKGVLLFNKVLLANPIFLIVAALVALGVILFLAYQRFEGFREIVDKAFAAIREGVSYAWENVIKPIFEALVAAVQEHLVPVIERLWKAFQEAWPGIQEALQTAWGVIQPILAWLIDLFVQIYTKYLTTLIQVWAAVFNAIITAVGIAWGFLQPIFNAIWAFIRDRLVPILITIGSTAKTIWDAIVAAVRAAWSFVQPIFNSIWAFIRDRLVPIFTRIGSVAKTVWDGIVAAIRGAWNIVGGVFDDLRGGLQTVIDFFRGAINTIGGIFRRIAGAITGAFTGVFDGIKNLWNSTLGGKGFDVPDWPGLPFRGQSFRFPEFHDGGIVPGRRGDEMLAMLEAGELIIPASMVSQMASPPPSEPSKRSDGNTVNVYVNKSDADPYQIGRELLWSMKVAG